MTNAPLSLIKTWVFLAQASDPKLSQAKADANSQLIEHFGSVEMAKIYLEQRKDKKIEVLLI